MDKNSWKRLFFDVLKGVAIQVIVIAVRNHFGF